MLPPIASWPGPELEGGGPAIRGALLRKSLQVQIGVPEKRDGLKMESRLRKGSNRSVATPREALKCNTYPRLPPEPKSQTLSAEAILGVRNFVVCEF